VATIVEKLKTPAFFRAILHYLFPVWGILKRRFRMWSNRAHADSREIDWDWNSTTYNRIAVVNLILKQFPNPRYLEIGCDKNNLFSSVPVSHKVGVDPVSGGTIRCTSDEFFLVNRDEFDVVFIDGLHEYPQVRRDVLNALKAVPLGGYVVLHDMLPSNWVEQHVPNISPAAWTGDVWKLAFELANTPGLEFSIIKIDHGVGVLRKLSNVQLSKTQSTLSNEGFSYFFENHLSLPLATWHQFVESRSR
jgi:hypothetical protein